MEFKSKEISLCKQVAEKHRVGIKYGEWYWSKPHNKPLLALNGGFESNEQEFMGIFKIWTISDCLEFLRRENWLGLNLQQYSGDWQVKIRKSIRATPRWN